MQTPDWASRTVHRRTVPSIFEPNRLPARNFRARAELNRGPNARAR